MSCASIMPWLLPAQGLALLVAAVLRRSGDPAARGA